jgi:5'-3' exonuclease
MIVKSEIICDVCQMVGHFSSDCSLIDEKFCDVLKGVVDDDTKLKVMAILNCKEESTENFNIRSDWQFVSISRLREFLAYEFYDLMQYSSSLNFWNFETALDDFVFLNFFVGNDFVPHLPCMRIGDGAIDIIIMVWKTVVQKANGFITNNGQIIMPNLKLFLSTIAKIEFLLFKEKNSKMS